MKVYAELPRHRNRQLAADAAVLAWAALWVWVGRKVYDLVEALRGPGETIEAAGAGFAGGVADVGEDVEGVPVVGGALRAAFESIGGAGEALRDAGVRHQEVIHDLALWLGILLAVIPIGYVLLRYLPERLRWIREASAAARLRIDAEDLQLFALRAVANRPLYELRRASPDPAGDLAAGRYESLAAIELGSLGLRPEPGAPGPMDGRK